MRVIGRPIIGAAELDDVRTDDVAREYLWSLQYTIAAGHLADPAQPDRERILGMPKGR